MKLLRIFLSVAVALASINLQANISPLAFKNVFQHFKPGYELYAPNIGCAALKNGTIDAIRFYNVIPGPKDDQGHRLYIQDKALKGDPFAELAILLFPSPAGLLTAMTSHSQSIGAQLTVHDVATLLNFCAKVRTTIKASEIRAHNKHYLMGGNEFGSNFEKAIKRLQSAEKNQVNIDYYKNFLINNHRFSMVLPRAQELLCMLCKCIELEERNDRRALFATNPAHYNNFEKYAEATFYPKYTSEMLLNAFFCLKFGSEQIQDLISSLNDHIVDHEVLFDDGLIDQTDLQQAAAKQSDASTLDDLWVIQNRELIDSIIPYARQCKPVNNGLACGYDRAHNQLLETETYPDCTETTLRHLCNLALYDKKTKNWNLQPAQQKISDPQILEFFDNFYQIQKPEKANSGEAPIRNAWSKVVNNLDGNIRYNKKYLNLSVNNDNEVDSGLVNIMRVLNIVFNCGFEPEPDYQNDQQYAQAVTTWVTNCLETFFKTLAPEKLNVEIQITNAQTYTATDNRKDCAGNISVKVGHDFEFKMSVISGHAQFDSITTIAPEAIKVSQEQIILCIQHHAQTLQHSGEQILLLNTAIKNSITIPLHQIFSANIIDSATIITMLNQLYQMMQNNQISFARAAVILRNALQRFLWQDMQMSSNIQPVLRNLYLLKNENIHTALRAEVKTIVSDLWISDCFADDLDALFKFFTVLETIDFRESGIKTIAISGDNCPNLKQLYLGSTKNLESVVLSGSLHQLERINLYESGIKTIAISGSCPNLKELSLGSTKNLESVVLSESFHQLKIINLYESGIKTITISGDNCSNLKQLYLGSTKNLESVVLSGSLHQLERIDLYGAGIKTIAISGDNCSNLKQLYLGSTKNLESVVLSGSLHQLETIDLYNSGIKTITISASCPNLKKLDLRGTQNLELLVVSRSLHQLETIDLYESGIKTIAISGDNCPNLKQLYLGSTKNLESVVLSESLHQLETINLYESGIKTIAISGSCPNLKQLSLGSTKNLESIEISGSLHQLETIDLYGAGIKTITISASCPNLKQLDLRVTQNLESLVLSGSFNNLETINLSNAGINTIAISGDNCPNLKQLNLSFTQNLELLELSGSLHQLETINLSFSRIKTITISGDNSPNLKQLNLSFTQNLESVVLSGSFNNLEIINLEGSKINELVLNKNSFPNLKDNQGIQFINQQEKKRARDDENDELDSENTKRQKLDEDEYQNSNNFIANNSDHEMSNETNEIFEETLENEDDDQNNDEFKTDNNTYRWGCSLL